MKKRNKKEKKGNMTAPRYGGGALLQINGRAQPGAGTSEKVQSGRDHTELGHVGRREEREPGAAAMRPPIQRELVTKMVELHREKQPRSWAGE